MGGTTGGTSSGSNGGRSGGANGGSAGGGSAGGGNQCGKMDFTLDRGLPPDLLIVLDRSGSMNDPAPMGSGSKWEQVTAALDSTVDALQGEIKWGLTIFPTNNMCGVASTIDVPIAANNAAAIKAKIDPPAQGPNGGTPTQSTLRTALKYFADVHDSNPRYVLLATDGAPNCAPSPGPCTCPPLSVAMGDQCCDAFGLGLCVTCDTTGNSDADDSAGAEQAVSDLAGMGVNTFVVGIGTGRMEEKVLNQMAINGKTARMGAQKYYPVGSGGELVDAVNQIAGQIISCTYPLQVAPEFPDDVDVTGDGKPIPRDTNHTNGWDYGSGAKGEPYSAIQFYGDACKGLQTGSIKKVEAIFNCKVK
jgi:hypothetical protein